MKKTISNFQPLTMVQWLLCAVLLLGMTNRSSAQSCSVDAGSETTVCAGETTGPLGGSFGGGATSAIWSDGGAGGTFSNNGGSTPGSAAYTASLSSFGNVTLTLSATGACEPVTATKTVVVNRLHTQDLVGFYDYSCDRTTFAFSPISQTFIAPFSGYISRINAGIGLWMTPTSYGTILSTASHMIDYGYLGYSGRCCYAMCVTGNNMASTNLPSPFYVNAGETVTISFYGSGGEKHYQDGILRMYIQGHPLVSGTGITADGPTTFCSGGSVNLSTGNFAMYSWTPSGNSQSINVTSTDNYSVLVGDVNGCSASASQSVTVNPLPTIGVNVAPASTVSTGSSVTLNGTGASTYNWSGGITNGVPFTATATDTYNVTGTDANGCVGTASQTITVTANNPCTLTATASSSNPLIFYGYAFDQVAPITVSTSGGSGTLIYSWSMSRGLNCNVVNSAGDEQLSGGWNVGCTCSTANCSTPVGTYNGTSFSAKLTSDANFTVVVTDANRCTATSTVHIDAIDARCFAGNSSNPKVQVCHHTGSPSNPYVTLCVSENAVAEMLAMGDCVGSCASYSNPMNCSGYRAESAEEIMMSEAKFTTYPNPFIGNTTISFSVPNDGNAVVRVFDAMGKQVSVLFDGVAKQGTLNRVEFNGENYAPGIYFYSIVSQEMSEVRRMELVK
jgi:hypothetical protein